MQPSAARRARSERGEKIHGGGRTRNSFMVLGTSFRPFRRGVGRGNQFWEIKRIKEIALTVENSDVRAVELVGGTGEKIAIPIAHIDQRSEEHTSELQSLTNLVCRLLLEKKKKKKIQKKKIKNIKKNSIQHKLL